MGGTGAGPIRVDPATLQVMAEELNGLPTDILELTSLLDQYMAQGIDATNFVPLKTAIEAYIGAWRSALIQNANGMADLSKGLTAAAAGYVAADQTAAKNVNNVG
jgi:hypothetical protein